MRERSAFRVGLIGLLGLAVAGGCSGSVGKDMRMAGAAVSAVGRLHPVVDWVGKGISAAGGVVSIVEHEKGEKDLDEQGFRPIKYNLPDPPEGTKDKAFAFVRRGDEYYDADMTGFEVVGGCVENDEPIWMGFRAVKRSGGGFYTHAYRDGELISSGFHVVCGNEPNNGADVFFFTRPISSEQELKPGRYHLEAFSIGRSNISYAWMKKTVFAKTDFVVVDSRED